MKSLTIHNINDDLDRLIRAKAREEGLSLNKTIKRLLEKALGMKPNTTETNRRHFDEFCGVWNDEDRLAFDQATSDLQSVDKGEWQ